MSNLALHPNSPRTIVSTNPARGYAALGEVQCSTQDEVQAAVVRARVAQSDWWAMGLEARIVALHDLREKILEHSDKLARLMSEEMGMPLTKSQAMVVSATDSITWDCKHAPEYLADDVIYEDEKEKNIVRFEPYGVFGNIVAWNFPLHNFSVSIVQALLAGNTAVMKYSEEVSLFGQQLEEIINTSALPKGVMNFVHGDGQVGAWLADSDIDFLTFTGSSATGQKLYQKAAEKFIPVSLELGGSSPGIVFEDCELDDEMIKLIYNKRFSNTGQYCSNLKRLIVHESRFDECVEKLVAYTKAQTIGDPFDPNVDFGPLVAERQVQLLEAQVNDAVQKGANVHCGGKRPTDLDGAFYELTILSNITTDMRVWREEVFGPALPVVKFSTYEEAIHLANDTDYGLTGYVYTNDESLAQRALGDIKAGAVYTQNATARRMGNPFGGYKASGLGRQRGKHGFHEVCQIKAMSWQKAT